MILLLGGTSETAPLATALATAGFKVLVSTATDVPLHVGDHPNISRRSGKLDRDQMLQLAIRQNVLAIVDASHPYASSVRQNARTVADQLEIPYVSWVRPRILDNDGEIHFEPNHKSAAKTAFSFGRPVLLTTGSRNLSPYVREAAATGVPLTVRVLDHPSSLVACRKAGIPDANIVSGRGPFSVDDNLKVIRRYGIGVVVTKDSGLEGGVPAKLTAARIADCRVVVVQRPAESNRDGTADVSAIVKELSQLPALSITSVKNNV